ncbi:pentapeptide repeat-containing protein [Streptomyces europaeiscabiei]|uniref:pentapeptide repeat-containing protein n=1 Tax=Streptomyces europaeiscabiei TaxID=146819 RepID=UPI0038D4608A
MSWGILRWLCVTRRPVGRSRIRGIWRTGRVEGARARWSGAGPVVGRGPGGRARARLSRARLSRARLSRARLSRARWGFSRSSPRP